MLRNLRIAVSASSLIACALLIALWVRSYWQIDHVTKYVIKYVNVYFFGQMYTSYDGQLTLVARDESWRPAQTRWVLENIPITEALVAQQRVVEPIIAQEYTFMRTPSPFRFTCKHQEQSFFLIFPHWFAALGFAVVAAAPWTRRFSLRAALVATTLVAVALALVASAQQ